MYLSEFKTLKHFLTKTSMNIFDALSLLGELLAPTPDKKSKQRSISEKSNSIIQLLSGLFIIIAFIILIIEIKFKYVPANLWLSPLLIATFSLTVSIGFSVLLNRFFNIQYTFTNFIVLILTMTLFISVLICTVNRITEQKLFKTVQYTKAF
jgi:predicted RND superfamily exporter protein